MTESSTQSPSNAQLPVVLLPGLDGGDLLLQRFRDAAPDPSRVSILLLPDEGRQDYTSLAGQLGADIQRVGACHLMAESFSGPLGILLAHRFSDLVRRLTLVATFAAAPVPPLLASLPLTMLFRLGLPTIVARHFLTGAGADESLVTLLQRSVSRPSTNVLAARVRALVAADVRRELSELRYPIDYVRPRQDRLVPRRAVDEITKANPGVRVLELDGSHLILQTKTREVWELIGGRGRM